ncbi:uncharacterized protein [Procambarus clarkii]|uniref:uncharacterized protein isoform X1 n=1 Tax=Procambarus clarkii TaxID=6728 RepID=UPI0037443224
MSRGARRAGHLTLLQVCVLCLGCRPSSSFTPTSSLILQSNEHLKGDNLPENSTSEATSDSGDQLCGERSADDPTPHCISAPREYPGRQANNGDDLGNEGEVAAVDDPTSRGEETTVHDPQKKPSDQDSLVRPTTVAGRSRTEGITRVVGLEGRRVVGLLPIVAPHVASRTSLGQRGRRAVDVLSMVAPSAASRMGRRQAQLIYQDEISVLSPKKPSGESSGEVQVSLTQLQQEEEEEEGGHSVFHQQQQLERVPVLSSLPRQQQQDNTSPLPQTQHDDFTSLGQQNNSPSQQHQHTRPSTQQQHQQHKGGSLLQKQQLNDHSLTHQQQLNDHSLTHQQPHNDHSLTHQQQHNNHSLTHQQQLNDHSLTHQQQHNNHSLTHQQQLNDHSLTHQQNYPSSVLQPDMDALRNLSLYYASLSWDKNDEGSRVEVPTPHQVLSHRRYLLMLLQKLRNVDEAMKVSTGNPANSFVTVSQSNPVTVLQSQEERVLPTGVPLLQHTHSATERWRGTSETEAPVPLGSSDPPDGGKSPNRSSTPVYQVPGGQISKPSNRDPSVSRIEQAPLDSLPDTQNLDVGPSSPPFNPLHSQGLLPSSFLGQVPSTTTPPTRLFDLLYDIQTGVDNEATSSEGDILQVPKEPLHYSNVTEDRPTFMSSSTSTTSSSIFHHPPGRLSSPRDFPSGSSQEPPSSHSWISTQQLPSSGTTRNSSQVFFRHPHENVTSQQRDPLVEHPNFSVTQTAINSLNQRAADNSSSGPLNIRKRYPLPNAFSYPSDDAQEAPPQQQPAINSHIVTKNIQGSSFYPTATAATNDQAPVVVPDATLLANYEALLKAIQVVKQINRLRQTSVSYNLSPSASGLPVQHAASYPPSTYTPTPDLYFFNDAAEGASKLAPKITTAVTTLITSVGEAISSFFQDLAKAISTFFENLASAIKETPAVLLLCFIPLFFILLSYFLASGKSLGFSHHHHHTSHGGGGYGGRKVSTHHLDDKTAEVLARLILSHIESFEKRVAS